MYGETLGLPLSALATAVGNNLRLKVAPNMADSMSLNEKRP